MKEPNIKALTHGALALFGLYEAFNTKTVPRKLLTGCLVGWHLHATFYHLVLEKDND